MNFTKFQNKLTSEEIHFFEKIFEDKEVKENFKYNNKKIQKYFICFYILSSISFISIIVGAFLESKNTIFISFALFLFFIILGIFLQKTNNKGILKNYQISQIIFKKIFELFSSNGNYKNPNGEELLKKTKNSKALQIINSLPIFQFSIGNISITGNESDKTQRLYISNRKQNFSTYFLNYTIYIEGNNFEPITFYKKGENKKNFYAGITIIIIITSLLIFIFNKYISDLGDMFIKHSEILLTIFSFLGIAIIGTIKEYKKLKNKHNQENNEFLKNFDIISENPNTIYSFNANIFEHFANLGKIDKNFNIFFSGNKIIFQKRITKIPHFHNSSNSAQKNISQYIKFYLEMKEIFYILSKI